MVASEAITLEYKMKKGETLQYKANVSLHQQLKEEGEMKEEQDVNTFLDMLMVQKVTEISGKQYDIDVTIESGNVKRNGEQEELPNVGQTVSVKMNRDGKITKTSVDFPFEQPPFPSKPVKLGESWKSDSKLSIPGKPEPFTLTYEYTLKDFAKVHGYDCAEIAVKCPETIIPLEGEMKQKLVAGGTTYFAHREGKLIKSEVETRTEVSAENTIVLTNTKVKVELLELAGPAATAAEEGYIVS
ncbi:MAG: hypothetical protein V2A78_05510 [bacterium]